MTQNSLESVGNISMTTQPSVRYSHPVTSGLRHFGVLPLVDLYGNVLSGTNAAKRLVTNFASKFPNGGPDHTLIGSPVQSSIYSSFSTANQLNLGLPDSPDFTVQFVGRSTSTNTGTDFRAVLGNFLNAAAGAIQIFDNASTKIRCQCSVITQVAAFTATIVGNQMTVTAISSGTLAVGQHITALSVVGGVTISLLAQDATIVSQSSGSAGQTGVYTISSALTSSLTGASVVSGTFGQTPVDLVLPDVTSWRAVSARFRTGYGWQVKDYTSGATANSLVGTALYPRSAPGPNNLTYGGSTYSQFRGEGDGIAFSYHTAYLNDNDDASAMAQLRKYATNRGIAA